MYAVEFEASIKNGIVHIPDEYQELQKVSKAKFVVIYEKKEKEQGDIQTQLDEFRKLRSKSNNKVTATMKLATDIDGLVDDGIF